MIRFSIVRLKNLVLPLAFYALLPALCASPVRVEAQPQTKIPKIGWLRARPASIPGTASVEIRAKLRELGYSEGKNIVFEYRYTEGKVERMPAAMNELVRAKVNLILASSTPEAVAARQATKTIPIILYSGGDPVTLGLVESQARPGGNLTGFTFLAPTLASKRLELLKETLPRLANVVVLWDQEYGSSQEWKQSQLVARDLGLQLQSVEIDNAENLDAALNAAFRARNSALSVTRSSLINRHQQKIVDLVGRHRLPAIYARADFVANGGLMSYGANEAEGYKRIAWMIDKILKGAKPADIPIEWPTRFDLVVNLATAKQIGLTIPPNVLARADRVIR
jgi:putative ABC transport system substrate-binding protein